MIRSSQNYQNYLVKFTCFCWSQACGLVSLVWERLTWFCTTTSRLLLKPKVPMKNKKCWARKFTQLPITALRLKGHWKSMSPVEWGFPNREQYMRSSCPCLYCLKGTALAILVFDLLSCLSGTKSKTCFYLLHWNICMTVQETDREKNVCFFYVSFLISNLFIWPVKGFLFFWLNFCDELQLQLQLWFIGLKAL